MNIINFSGLSGINSSHKQNSSVEMTMRQRAFSEPSILYLKYKFQNIHHKYITIWCVLHMKCCRLVRNHNFVTFQSIVRLFERSFANVIAI